MSLLRAETAVTLLDPQAMVEAFHAYFQEHLPMTREGGAVRFESDFGHGTISAEGGRFSVSIACTNENTLVAVKAMFAEHLVEFSGDKSIDFRWTGDGAKQRTSPNLSHMTVARAFHITPRMRRVTLKSDDLARFAAGGLHIRILFAPKGREPVWPYVAQNGAIVWPEGDDKLLTRVYTMRRLDVENGEMDLDFVMHPGDEMPGATWGANAAPGDIVAIMGPGGGGMPSASHYILLGDETALPVMARMTQQLQPGQDMTVFCEIADMQEVQDIEQRPGLYWHWLPRNGAHAGTAGQLEKAVRARFLAGVEPDTFFFAACEKSEARILKAFAVDELKMPRTKVRTAAYWVLGRTADERHDD